MKTYIRYQARRIGFALAVFAVVIVAGQPVVEAGLRAVGASQ